MSDQHKLPRAGWYRLEKGSEWKGGVVHYFGTDANGDPIGIVEDDKAMTVHRIYIEHICFASIPPK